MRIPEELRSPAHAGIDNNHTCLCCSSIPLPLIKPPALLILLIGACSITRLVDSSANIVQNGARHDDPPQNGVALGLDQKVSWSFFVLANNSTNVTSYFVISHANERPYIGSVVHNMMLIFILIPSTVGATDLCTLLNFGCDIKYA